MGLQLPVVVDDDDADCAEELVGLGLLKLLEVEIAAVDSTGLKLLCPCLCDDC